MRLSLSLALGLLIGCGGKTADGTTTDDAATDSSASGDTSATSDTSILPDGGGGDFTKCPEPGTCVLAAKSCCGVCGAPTLKDVAAVHESQVAAYSKAICPMPEPCPDCPSALEPNLQAFCRSGRCAAVDIRTDDLSSCAKDDDCLMRYEACCECGASGDFNIIALNAMKAVDYSRERCKPSTGCPECAPAYPATLRAVCDAATKHCVVKPT